MREKLIELLESTVSKEEVAAYGEVYVSTRRIADHLIANGVTIHKWIPVSERLPDKDGEYLVRLNNKSIINLKYERKFGSFGYWLSIILDEDAEWFTHYGVTHWMPLPEPPKEEE